MLNVPSRNRPCQSSTSASVPLETEPDAASAVPLPSENTAVPFGVPLSTPATETAMTAISLVDAAGVAVIVTVPAVGLVLRQICSRRND